MPRFFFDLRDDDRLSRDEEGLEFDGLDAACADAARALGEIAKDVLPRSRRRDLAIDVRDEAKRLLLRANLRFEATFFRPSSGAAS